LFFLRECDDLAQNFQELFRECGYEPPAAPKHYPTSCLIGRVEVKNCLSKEEVQHLFIPLISTVVQYALKYRHPFWGAPNLGSDKNEIPVEHNTHTKKRVIVSFLLSGCTKN
jgi:hypothetical protein